jgi:hypothetical protein
MDLNREGKGKNERQARSLDILTVGNNRRQQISPAVAGATQIVWLLFYWESVHATLVVSTNCEKSL